MNLEGRIVRLRAVEPEDAELLYAWENDTSVWSVSGTTEPFSRAQMERFIAAQLQGGDLFRTGQLRLIVETRAEARPVGIADLFEFDPLNRRAGLGILIHDDALRGKGYASDAVETACRYAREVLNLHQLWCNVGSDNAPSRRLFAKAGFAEIGVKRDWLWQPDGYGDEILLQKILE